MWHVCADVILELARSREIGAVMVKDFPDDPASAGTAAHHVNQPGGEIPVPNDTEIRPFRVDVPEEEVAELRRRFAATRWPDKETVADRSQGVQLAKLQDLVTYWGTDYDWRKFEAKLNARLPP
jgi:hypothetical protein